jgi:hypothetical protein
VPRAAHAPRGAGRSTVICGNDATDSKIR